HAMSGEGTHFAVWAPNARSVSVVHDHNAWDPGADHLQSLGASGIWAGHVLDAREGTHYKYKIETADGRYLDKADPFAFTAETPPSSASVVADMSYDWGDGDWVSERADRQAAGRPVSVYEVHLGSWRRGADGRYLGYRDIAARLADHMLAHGFTHAELLPVMEHPYYGSWGYQSTGYFAPTSRYGSPTDFMAFVDTLHQAGLGVILDWVPSHFATDGFGLGEFDGTHLFEHADPRQRIHPDWGSYEFNYGRHEVRSFLISNACFWLDRYHVDGLRVDAVASMLYLDYSRKAGEWVPNAKGGRENLDAISFLRELNEAVHEEVAGVLTIAEESTAWPGVSKPVSAGGLGFDHKWDMGWMHDTLLHLSRDPVHRRFHYGELTFRGLYAWTERFVLPLSHDEVVHGKGSLAGKMPGDDWQRLANVRLLYGLQWLQPGRKLLFMGGELAGWHEWNHESQLEWGLEAHPDHAGVGRLVADLNLAYRTVPALHEREAEPDGFRYVVADDDANDVLAWLRLDGSGGSVLAVANCTPVVRSRYRIGVPVSGPWHEVLNSDAADYGGSGVGNLGG
ncbi:MAG TPA: 1,4-alpha-glucan branching protein GlgB, partial [Acidimicrobiales bacterium]|nr:1,4-alpha-glucan branching protein GlgB [Acidimicrobiales bacterium]